MNDSEARWAALVAQGEQLDLLEGALLVAGTGRAVDEPRTRAAFEALLQAARARLSGVTGEAERLEALLAFFYAEQGFHGDAEDYHHPRNSHLDQVLARRAGIPITLALLLVELGRRLGVPLAGVGFPGHFLVRCEGQPPLLLDPFAGGRRWSEQECRERFRRITGGKVRFHPRYLEPAPRIEVLARMLRNLKGAHLRRGEHEPALAAISRLLLVDPAAHEELRDRGQLHMQRGAWREASADLREYLRRQPQAPDRPEVQAWLDSCQTGLWSMN